MRPPGSQDFGTGNIYEMCVDRVRTREVPQVLDRWGEVIHYREKYSPLAACWYTEFGRGNRMVHMWVYKDFKERARVLAEVAKDTHWPLPVGDLGQEQVSQILIPGSVSPLA